MRRLVFFASFSLFIGMTGPMATGAEKSEAEKEGAKKASTPPSKSPIVKKIQPLAPGAKKAVTPPSEVDQRIQQLLGHQESIRLYQTKAMKIASTYFGKMSPELRVLFAQLDYIQHQGPCENAIKSIPIAHNSKIKGVTSNFGQLIVVKKKSTEIYTDTGLVTIDGRNCNVDPSKNKKDAVYELIAQTLPSQKAVNELTDLTMLRANSRNLVETLIICDPVMGTNSKAWTLLKKRRVIDTEPRASSPSSPPHSTR